MRIAYFDCFSGASGDMILGALIDAGLDPRLLRQELKKFPVSGIDIKARKVLRRGISGTQVVVEGKKERRSHRNLNEMVKIIKRSRLETEVKEQSAAILERIASVEAKIHRCSVEEIHFHELGGLDSIVDIVGAVWSFRQMGFEEIHVSKINVGSGFVRCEHGVLPVPAPATLALMKGKPLYSSGVERELLTPTGAAILTTLGSGFGQMPAMKVERIGYGAGKDDLPHPNLLRLMIGKSDKNSWRERVDVIETNIDDMNPQFYDYLMERLFKMEVQEVFLTPLLMKKNRPATLLTIICSPDKLTSITEFLLKETTTIGLRWHEEERAKAEREILRLQTRYGSLRFKLARWEGKVINFSPEYDDCKRLAIEKGIPLKDVFEEAKRTSLQWQSGHKKTVSH